MSKRTDNVTPIKTDDIIDIDLSVTKKKKFRFDKDDNRILEMDTSDLNIISRMSDAYPKLMALQEKASKLMDGIDVDSEADNNVEAAFREMGTMSERLKDIDKDMRDLIDFIFDTNASEITAPSGSMYDPFHGNYRFEYIIEVLMKQFETNLQSEYAKMTKQMAAHTDKYTKGH